MTNKQKEINNDIYSGFAWDNSNEYSSLEGDDFFADITKLNNLVETIQEKSKQFLALIPEAAKLNSKSLAAIAQIDNFYLLTDNAIILSNNLSTFISCELSIDGTNTKGRILQSQLQQTTTHLYEALQYVDQLMFLVSDEFIITCCEHENIKTHKFSLTFSRWFKPFLLSLPEEVLIKGLDSNGPNAWASLYNNISSSLTCNINNENKMLTMGMANANKLLSSDDATQRQNAYLAINKAWSTQKESCASILNALAGWRLDLCKRRSHKQQLHFLDIPLHSNRISKKTLDTMMTVVNDSIELGQRAMQLQAKALGKSALDPWDTSAPPVISSDTNSTKFTFIQAIELIKKAFADINPHMGDFVQLMQDNSWIEGRLGNNKRHGAYCTKFVKSKTPRVYMTYNGSLSDINTLAHELGHAFHFWTMRTLPLNETYCPATLAETASIFAENLITENITKNSNNPKDLLPLLWNDIKSVSSFLLNVPACFDFEKNFYELRQKRILTPDDFNELTINSKIKYFGTTLSSTNEMYWASTMHFYMGGRYFYNFPYTFGYLFSLGVYAQRKHMGKDFYQAYVNLLQDTGRMTTEDLARKHLGVDIEQPDFWRNSMDIVKQKIQRFENIFN